jgi:glycolate oxidase iron-sulfur subunit
MAHMRTDLPAAFAETPAGLIAEGELRACVHCGFCNATCPTYRLTGDELDGPRGRIYLIKQALEGGPVSRLTQAHLDRCLGCRACETTCPSGVAYHRLYEVGRAAVDARIRRPWPERLTRWLLREGVSRPGLFRLAVRLGHLVRPVLPAALRRKLPALRAEPAPTPGDHPRRMLLLAGCVQSVAAGHFNAATVRVLDRLGVAVRETPGVGCCGALHAHLGDPDGARALARRNIAAWEAALEGGAEAILANASGCAHFLAEYADLLAQDPDWAARAARIAGLVRDPLEVIEALAPHAVRPPAQPRIAVHDPCTLQHGLKLSGRVARLLAGLGYQPQPVSDAHLCCGSAGAYSVLQPELAGRLREAKLEALLAAAPAGLYTGNIGCWMHLAETSPVPVRHWIEAVDAVI